MRRTDRSTVTLTRRMMIYVSIIVFSSLVLGIEFLIDVNGSEPQRGPEYGLQDRYQGEIDTGRAAAPIDRIRTKVIFLIAIQSLVTGVVLVLFVKKITIPLRRMFAVTGNMARGDFENPIPVYIDDEIGRLGRFINDVVSDFGEVIGHVRIAGDRCREHIRSMKTALEDGDRRTVLAEMERLSEQVEQLEDMTRNFHLARADLSRLKR
jgi:methyl-accepting chemotaxis protein